MTLPAIQHLQAERSELEEMLAHLPESNVIDRLSLSARKEIIESTLASKEKEGKEPFRARLTFRGKPVVGSHRVFAEFGAVAVGKFADTIAAFAASTTQELGSRGRVPNRKNFQLLITDTAFGSFGFELEESLQENELPLKVPSPVEQAVKQTVTVMSATLGSDDDLTEAAVECDPRALASLRDFLQTLADHEAVCSLNTEKTAFHFQDVEEIRKSATRLNKDNIHEKEQTLKGFFQGVLPKRRTFEFRVASTDEVIIGKVGVSIEDARVINKVLENFLQITVKKNWVGTGRPRYVLLDYEPPDDANLTA